MADMLTTRPPGEVMCHIDHPIYRFGLSMAMAVRTHDGSVYYASLEPSVGCTTDVVWRLYKPNEQPPPLMFLDEEMATAMLRALSNAPATPKGDRVFEHLTDAMDMRDRLFEMLRAQNDRQHEVVMKALAV